MRGVRAIDANMMDHRPSSEDGMYDDNAIVVGDTRLFAAAIARKRAEQDAMLLANRIALLRAEENKAQKKIEETKKRANEIIDLRRRNEDRRQQKEDLESKKDSELGDFRDKLFEKREETTRRINSARESLQSQRSARRQKFKEESTKIEEQRKVERAGEYSRAAAKRDRIRTAAIALAHRRSKVAEDKEIQARRAFEERITLQEQTRHEKEDLIMQMEREEVDLIQRLQQTQQRQRAAYDQLEDILQQPASATVSPVRGSSAEGGRSTTAEKAPGSARKAKPTTGAGGEEAHEGKATYTTVSGDTIEVTNKEEDLDLWAVLGEERK